MSWATGLMVYLVIWWTILFAVLPLGVRRVENPGRGQDRGAPERPQLLRKALREALRLKCLSIDTLDAYLARATGWNRPASLTRHVDRYRDLQLHRCRSDAEALAVVTLADAGIEPPRINVRVAREEADLSWPDKRLIIEHPLRQGWHLVETDKPIETTPALYRFKGKVAAGKAAWRSSRWLKSKKKRFIGSSGSSAAAAS